MGLIEAILLGLQLERLQKPFVFFSMLIGLVFFSLSGFVILYVIYDLASTKKSIEFLPVMGILSMSLLFFGLAAVCGHMIKKCFK